VLWAELQDANGNISPFVLYLRPDGTPLDSKWQLIDDVVDEKARGRVKVEVGQTWRTFVADAPRPSAKSPKVRVGQKWQAGTNPHIFTVTARSDEMAWVVESTGTPYPVNLSGGFFNEAWTLVEDVPEDAPTAISASTPPQVCVEVGQKWRWRGLPNLWLVTSRSPDGAGLVCDSSERAWMDLNADGQPASKKWECVDATPMALIDLRPVQLPDCSGRVGVLARALFEEELEGEAEIKGEGNRTRAFHIMWTKTKLDVRKRCEDRAQRLFDRISQNGGNF
jgi:hypothetical protein